MAPPGTGAYTPHSMSTQSRPLTWDPAFTLFLTAICSILVEVLLTRVLSVVMWYHFTFAVVSISMLGIAAGAMHGYRAFPRIDDDSQNARAFRERIPLALMLLGLSVAVPVALMMRWVETPTYSWRGALLLLVYFLACALPFFFSGYITALIFRCGAGRVSGLYAIDLLAGASGCLLAIPLLDHLGGIGSLLMISAALSVGSLVQAWRADDRRGVRMGAFVALAFLGLIGVKAATSTVDVHTVKLSLREELGTILESKWNSHSRLAVLDYYHPDGRDGAEFLAWGLSDRYTKRLPHQYLITIDGGSETPIAELKGELKEHDYLEWDVTSIPYHVRPEAKTLVIGAGGGRDLLTSLYFGSQDVTGVELNRGIVEWMLGTYAEFSGHVYTRPGVKVHVDDGRNFIRSSSDRFDVVQISMVDTFAATAAGAYSLSENNLYTAEAFDEYLDHLKDDGLFSMNRFFLEPPQQTLRVVTLAREALERRGVKDAARCLVVVRKNSPHGNNGLVMMKKTPFTDGELAKVNEVVERCGFEPIAVPGIDLKNPFTAYLQSSDVESFYRAYPFDIRPPTDDRPFFFNTFKMSMLQDSLRLRESIEVVRRYNFDAVFIVFVLLVLACVSLLLFLFIPLLRASREGRAEVLPFTHLLYFVWIGLGFIFIEVVLIQRFHLYLGHPIYSLAVILVSLLAFSGLGSAITSRWSDARLPRVITITCAGIVVAVLAQEVYWPLLLRQTLGLDLTSRIGITVLSLVPMGLLMGAPYPAGLRVIASRSPESLPWVWAVNGAATVMGSIAAFALAMVLGFRLVLVLGGLCYAGALLTARASLHPRT